MSPPPPRHPSRRRVLLIAEACNPEWVSVPLVGWSHARAIAKCTDAHLVTQIRNRPALLRAGLIEGRDFTAIDSEPVARRIWRIASFLRGGDGKGWTTDTALAAIAYPYFEKLVWKKFGRRIRSGEFDIVHRLTPLSPTMSSLLAPRCRMAGAHFILGPLNGGVPWPRGFDTERRNEREWLSYIRSAHKLLPGYLATRRHASAILIGSRDTWGQMPRSFHPKCFYLPENAIDPNRFRQHRTRQAQFPIRAVFIGRLVPYKGADMLIEAAAPLIKAGRLQLDILGDGPQMPALRHLAEEQGIGNGLNFSGWIEHDQLQQRLVDRDILTFPSIREFGGGVVLEAMAVGVVPIIVDYGGPAELVTDRTGFRIPMGRRDQIIARLRALLTGLCENPAQIDARSAPAIQRVHRQFTWDAKAKHVMRIYDWLRNPAGSKPHFDMPTPDPDRNSML